MGIEKLNNLAILNIEAKLLSILNSNDFILLKIKIEKKIVLSIINM